MSEAGRCAECGKLMPDGVALCDNCKTRDLPRSAAEAFPAIPGYRFERLVGEGGMGVVCVAEEVVLARRVAIKLISPEHRDDPDARGRFQREARSMATIDHPNVVRIHTFGEVEGRPYFVMEYVEGETLAQLIKHQGALPAGTALHILRCTVSALRAAAEKDIVHRDVKPGNVLIDRGRQVKVSDFGLAKKDEPDPR